MKSKALLHKPQLAFWICILFSGLHALPTLTFAALPIIGPQFSVEITITEHLELEQELSTFIKKEQSTNQQLKDIKDINQYRKLLAAILQKKLKSLGYYDFGLSISEGNSDISFLVQPGQRATIDTVQVSQPEFVLENLKEIVLSEQLKPGQPLLAQAVLDSEQRLIDHINKNYCFVEPRLSKTITMNNTTKKAALFFNLETEPGKKINEIQFEGNTTIDDDFLRNSIKIKKDCFKSDAVRKAQISLLQSGLLTSATPSIIPVEDAVDVLFEVNERKHRTQRIGIGYSSEEQIRLTAGWENRNWRGNGKRLSADFKISQITTQVNGALRVPQFRDPDLALLLQAELAETKVEAFDSVSAETSAILEYQFNNRWLGSAGVASAYSKVNSSTQDNIYRLLSFPVSIRRDTTRNLLDPVQGSIWSFSVQPFTDLVDPEIQFTQFATSYSFYNSPKLFSLNRQSQKSFTLANRIATGSITGEKLESVPADHRYYVGGGGSVRGFEYQSLSPKENDVIAGGLSFVEIASELRLRFNQNWGASLFVDAGAGFESQNPDLSARLSLGGGFGIRYMTSFAPIRLDIAWPLSSPIEFENKAQLYVGLKQAF